MKYDSIAALLVAYIQCYGTVMKDPADIPVLLEPAKKEQIAQAEIKIGKNLPPEYRDFLLFSNGLRSEIVYHLYSTHMLESYYEDGNNEAMMLEILEIAPFPGNLDLSQVTIFQGTVKNRTMSFIVSDPDVREYGYVFQWMMGVWDEAPSLQSFLERHIDAMYSLHRSN